MPQNKPSKQVRETVFKQEEPGKPKGEPVPRGDTPPKKEKCKVKRLAILIGKANDKAIATAEDWLVARAKALGGTFHLWTDRSAGTPLDSFQAHDISGGKAPNVRTGETYGIAQQRTENGKRLTLTEELQTLMAGCRGCKGRIEELVIIHHGRAVDEDRLAKVITKIFLEIRVPVCRVVWWSCNAAVSLDMRESGATDTMMRILGGSSIGQCEPCGCKGPITLIWPTAGKCHITGPLVNDELQTNDGLVNKARWGYTGKDGKLEPRPPKGEKQPLRRPPDRDPAYPQEKPLTEEEQRERERESNKARKRREKREAMDSIKGVKDSVLGKAVGKK